jgi:hypothetical protein
MTDRDSRLYDTHENGIDVVRILEQEVSELSFVLAASERGTGALNPRVLERVVYRQRRSSSGLHDRQSLFLLP